MSRSSVSTLRVVSMTDTVEQARQLGVELPAEIRLRSPTSAPWLGKDCWR
jgi:hypothetical protein